MFANKLNVVQQHSEHKQFADVAYYGLPDPKIESMFNKLSENIYFIGVSIDGVHTISLGTKTPILLLCNLEATIKRCTIVDDSR